MFIYLSIYSFRFANYSETCTIHDVQTNGWQGQHNSENQLLSALYININYLNDTIRFDVSSEGPSSFFSLIPDDPEGPLLETSNLIVLFR